MDQEVGGARPDIGGRRHAEGGFVARQRLGILGEMARLLVRPAGGRLVMERTAKDVGAEAAPIVAGIGEVEVPRLVDRVGRGHDMAGGDRQEGEALVFPDDAAGVRLAPAVLAREPAHEGERAVVGADGVMGERRPDRVVESQGRVPRRAHLISYYISRR
jgi:hypothetical protein